MSDRDARFTNEDTFPQQTLPNTPVTKKQSPIISIEEKVHDFHQTIKRTHLFSSFCENPSNVSFQTQEAGEKVLLFLRKTVVLNIVWTLATIVLALLPLLLYPLKDTFASVLPPLRFLYILVPMYYLAVVMYAFVNFITWYFNVALITDKRIVDIEFHQLVMKDIAETKLALVQDVSYRQIGVLENMFGFGHVLVQTAGTIENFEFDQLPQPARVVEVVEGLIGGKRFYEP